MRDLTIDADRLARELVGMLGAGVQRDPASLRAHAVDGLVPQIRCAPKDTDELCAILRVCDASGAAVIPWGGGTAMHWGNPPSRADVVISLEQFNRLVEHDDANLTATVQAGMRVAALQELLGGRHQCLAIDPPDPQHSTIGGTAAANINGPRRMAYGGVRDLVIGMKMVLASGEPIKAGGKVVKNVAGYDMCKLFVGSLGTLGVITEVTFKMTPLPETAGTIVARGSLAQTASLIDTLFGSALTPAAVTVVDGRVAAAAGLQPAEASVAVWAEGFTETVARHVRDVQAMAGQSGMTTEVVHDIGHRRLWETVRDFGAVGAPPVVFRLTVPPADVMPVLAAVRRLSDGGAVGYVAHAGTGTVWLAFDTPAPVAAWFPRLAALAQEYHGHAVLAAAPPEVKHTVDVWGPSPPALGLMQELKRQFDPHGTLNPGRFVAGI